MKLLRTSSISLNVRPSFFVLGLLLSIYFGASVSASFLIMGVLFLVFFFHELGHLAVARLFGRPCDMVIGGAGGRTEVYGPILKFWQRTAILLGGLLATYFVLVGMSFWVYDGESLSEDVRKYVYLFYTLTVWWFWCNLLPLYPFDGGQIALDIGASLFGRFGRKAVAVLSILLAGFLALYLFLEGIVIGAIVCFYCLMQSFVLFRYPAALRHSDLSEDALLLHELRQQWLSGDKESVIAQLQKLASESNEKEVRQEAVECCSGYLLASDRPRDAYEMLTNAKDPLVLSALEHLQLAAYKTSHWQEGLTAGEESFRECQTLVVATMCALLASRLALEEEAIGWLMTAKRLGLENISSFLEASDFDSIRASAAFQRFSESKNLG